MITFLIKSTVCLFVLYGFYNIFLRHQKILLFNRFYLIFSLVFSLLIPLFVIPIKSNSPINNTIERFSLTTGQLIQGETITKNMAPVLTLTNVLIALFIIISSILFIRFTLNIFGIFRQILKCKKIHYFKTTLVCLEERTLPYSFFRYIFVNQSDFENGKIEKELLIHEEAHCLQYHSIDVMIIELLKVFLWFNPAIWLIRKSILLNHEYYADNKVLKYRDPIDYQTLLLNILLRNNSNYLVSNFKYTFIRSRLNMMTKSNPLHNAIMRKIFAITLFLIMAITLTFSQEIKKVDSTMNYQKSWWYPILKKHNIEPRGFNTFDPVFEMGTTNSINDKVVTLKNAIFLIRQDSNIYIIMKSPLAYHNLDMKTIEAEEATLKSYSTLSRDTLPITTHSFTNLTFQISESALRLFTTIPWLRSSK
jgi:beta-lactamase regulating signal transducer with metallopeptidase domain